MIPDHLLRALATQHQTTELNLRREYFQHRFLACFFQQPATHGVFFKGGTALRIVYRSPRFSEDLDFSAATSAVPALEDALLDTLADLARENLHPELLEAKTTSGGYLALIAFGANAQSPVSIQLEISQRAGDPRGEAMTIVSDFSPAYLVLALAQEQLVDEKIQALLSRQKARDFYDLYFILRANLLPPHRRAGLGPALETVRRSRLNFEMELKEFLPRSHHALLRDFPTTLAREIERFL